MDHKRNANILENIYIFRTLPRREAAIYPDSGGLGRLGIVFRLHIVDAEEFVLIEVSFVQFHGQFRICTASKNVKYVRNCASTLSLLIDLHTEQYQHFNNFFSLRLKLQVIKKTQETIITYPNQNKSYTIDPDQFEKKDCISLSKIYLFLCSVTKVR
jgi:hypothetical protein